MDQKARSALPSISEARVTKEVGVHELVAEHVVTRLDARLWSIEVGQIACGSICLVLGAMAVVAVAAMTGGQPPTPVLGPSPIPAVWAEQYRLMVLEQYHKDQARLRQALLNDTMLFEEWDVEFHAFHNVSADPDCNDDFFAWYDTEFGEGVFAPICASETNPWEHGSCEFHSVEDLMRRVTQRFLAQTALRHNLECRPCGASDCPQSLELHEREERFSADIVAVVTKTRLWAMIRVLHQTTMQEDVHKLDQCPLLNPMFVSDVVRMAKREDGIYLRAWPDFFRRTMECVLRLFRLAVLTA